MYLLKRWIKCSPHVQKKNIRSFVFIWELNKENNNRPSKVFSGCSWHWCWETPCLVFPFTHNIMEFGQLFIRTCLLQLDVFWFKLQLHYTLSLNENIRSYLTTLSCWKTIQLKHQRTASGKTRERRDEEEDRRGQKRTRCSRGGVALDSPRGQRKDSPLSRRGTPLADNTTYQLAVRLGSTAALLACWNNQNIPCLDPTAPPVHFMLNIK